MLGTQAVETIDMLFSAHFPLPCFSLCAPLKAALHLSERYDLHKHQNILLSIYQRKSRDLQNISISRLHLHHAHICFAYAIFARSKFTLTWLLTPRTEAKAETADVELLGH